MRTALDTNVISVLWSKEPAHSVVVSALAGASSEGGIVISAVVYAELLAHPKVTEEGVNGFLDETGIFVDFDLQKPVWLNAGHRFARYAERRRRSGSEAPRRLLTDFVIGAHALTAADRLMTLDPKRYERDFPELKLVKPF